MADRFLFGRLQDWQTLKGYSDGQLAEEIGCDRTVLSRAKRGLSQLKMKHQIALKDLTGIKPSEWADFYAEVEAARGDSGASPYKKSPENAALKGAA